MKTILFEEATKNAKFHIYGHGLLMRGNTVSQRTKQTTSFKTKHAPASIYRDANQYVFGRINTFLHPKYDSTILPPFKYVFEGFWNRWNLWENSHEMLIFSCTPMFYISFWRLFHAYYNGIIIVIVRTNYNLIILWTFIKIARNLIHFSSGICFLMWKSVFKLRKSVLEMWLVGISVMIV